jgi:hypothetical protein
MVSQVIVRTRTSPPELVCPEHGRRRAPFCSDCKAVVAERVRRGAQAARARARALARLESRSAPGSSLRTRSIVSRPMIR